MYVCTKTLNRALDDHVFVKLQDYSLICSAPPHRREDFLEDSYGVPKYAVGTDNYRNTGRGGFQQRDFGPPATGLGKTPETHHPWPLLFVMLTTSLGGGCTEMGKFMHACEGEMVSESINPKVPMFNAQMFLEKKTAVGKVDEILGPINQVYFTLSTCKMWYR
jgi:hypothetical protein